jgi:hypothetical protein
VAAAAEEVLAQAKGGDGMTATVLVAYRDADWCDENGLWNHTGCHHVNLTCLEGSLRHLRREDVDRAVFEALSGLYGSDEPMPSFQVLGIFAGSLKDYSTVYYEQEVTA